MHSIFHFLTADNTSLGRFDPVMLTDHMLMEIFYAPDDYEKSRAAMGGDEDNACTWRKIRCDEDQNVTHIEWHSINVKLHGSMHFQSLPPKLMRCNIYNQQIRGEIDTSNFPRSLKYFSLQRTQMTGTVDLGNLPLGLNMLFIMNNEITALTNVVNLPASITDIAINEKNLREKTIFVGKLPGDRVYLDFIDCGFTDIRCADPADRSRIYTAEADLPNIAF